MIFQRELDHAMLRRLEKRILVDLPIYEARRSMFHSHLPPIVNPNQDHSLELLSDLDYDLLARVSHSIMTFLHKDKCECFLVFGKK